MNDRSHFVFGIFVGFLMTALGLALPSVIFEASKYKSAAIERGYAEYNQKTGEWGWK